MSLVTTWLSQAQLPCAIVKHDNMGHLCGYVGVPRSHPWYETAYNDCTLPEARPRGEKPSDFKPLGTSNITLASFPSYYSRITKTLECTDQLCQHTPEAQIKVHGGLTYSNWGFDPIPRDGEWWFGFDCAHLGDLVPYGGLTYSNYGMADREGDIYRDESYVRAECEGLAEQLAKVGKAQ